MKSHVIKTTNKNKFTFELVILSCIKCLYFILIIVFLILLSMKYKLLISKSWIISSLDTLFILYDNLFIQEFPEKTEEGKNFISNINM